eukprot:ctg_4627.g665
MPWEGRRMRALWGGVSGAGGGGSFCTTVAPPLWASGARLLWPSLVFAAVWRAQAWLVQCWWPAAGGVAAAQSRCGWIAVQL